MKTHKSIAKGAKGKKSKVSKTIQKPSVKAKNFDLSSVEEQLKNLEESALSGNRKARKKIRQLEFLKKRYVQMMNTQESLRPEGDSDVEMDDGEKSATDEENLSDEKTEDKKSALKGIKRFVVFVGNLPKSVKEEDLKNHFHKVGTIKSIRIPEPNEKRKSGFAFIELEDSETFEKTLSLHHTMLNNKRINVLYTNPDGSNLDRKEIKKKNAKFDAMRKAGILTGSIAEHKKRSFRRKKKRLAEAKASASVIR